MYGVSLYNFRNAGQEMFGDKMNGFQRRPSRPAEHKRMALFNVQGLVVSTDTCTRDQIRKVIWFKSLEKDIFVGSFPRAGELLIGPPSLRAFNT